MAKINHLLGQLDIITGDGTKEDIEQFEKTMLNQSKPDVYNIHKEGNAELKLTNEFNQFVFLVEEYTTKDVRAMPTTEYFDLLDYIEEKNKPKQK